MVIRKTGSVTGEVTEVEPGDAVRITASGHGTWGLADDQDLAAENAAADQGDD